MSAKNLKREFTSETVAKYRPFVTIVAQAMAKKLPPHVDFDELVQWGMLGLVDAIEKWDPNRKNKFKTYAEVRIRGAILDGLRGEDIVTRNTRDKQKAIGVARRSVEAKKGRAAMPFEIANELGLCLPEYLKLLKSAQGSAEFSIYHDQLFTPQDRKALLVSAEKHSGDTVSKIEAHQKLELYLKGIESVDRACVVLFYVWGLTQVEIGELFGCTGSRISQRIANVHSYNISKGTVNYGE